MSGYIGNGPLYGRGARYTFIVSGGATSVSGADSLGLTLNYVPGFEMVYLNGFFLPRTDYVATTGSSITGFPALQAGDVVDVIAMGVQLAEGGLARTSILGTVSQIGGLPTGAIIETGSNGNGTYTKFADGTMICSQHAEFTNQTFGTRGGIGVSTGWSWTFPTPFIAAPRVFVTGVAPSNLDGPYWGAPYVIGNSSATIAMMAPAAASNVSLGTDRMAIGRWFT